MNTSLYVALSRQKTLERALEVAANNVANADTAGFKVEEMMVREEKGTPSPRWTPMSYALDKGVARDFTQGSLEQTGGAYDLAVDGDGFFQVQTAQGLRYTRDGRFTTDNKNQLVTKAGDPVLDSGGRPIVLDPRRGQPAIGQDGTVSQGGASLGRIGVYRFPDRAALQKAGFNLFQVPAGTDPLAAPDSLVRQGSVEHSNVQPVLEITNLIQITRAYERIAHMMDQSTDLDSRSIDRLGKVN